MKTGAVLTAVVGGFMSTMAMAALQPDELDSRVRTYVYPVRVIWQTPASPYAYGTRFEIENSNALLERKRGQVPENGFWKGADCKLKNVGVAPGVLLDFGREIHGGVQLGCGCGGTEGMKVRIRFGESVSEAMSEIGENGATNDHAIRDAVYQIPVNGTAYFGDTGFRFVRIDLVTTGCLGLDFVRAVSIMRPMPQLGDFKCSDERLNRIWKTAVDTVHLCCQERLWDGIKRDRLVWVGDMHPETMAILNVFGGASVLKESIDYVISVTDPKTEWMNGLAPYTFWWMRIMADWYRYTGDLEYIRRNRDYLADTVAHAASYITPSNTFSCAGGMFLDWPTEHNRPAVEAGMQGLAVLGFDEAAYLADALGDVKLNGLCRSAVDRLKRQTRPSPNGSKQAAAMLALSGLWDAERMFADVLGRNGHEGVSTFYGYYMLEAMCKAGARQRALSTVRDYWGAMLDVGATSFWENFDTSWTNNCFGIDVLPVAGKKDVHGDYGEFCYPGFRHSLCHGWSAGPASWLVNHVLGIRPIEPGCHKVEIRPFLGDLDWAEGAMAVPGGRAVWVRVERSADGRMTIAAEAPEGIEIVGEGVARIERK